MTQGVELATAWIRIVPSLEGLSKELADAVLPEASKPANALGQKLLDGIGKTFKVGAAAVGGIAVAGITTAIIKGFDRLKALDQARASLRGLGHDAESVDQIMANALASVDKTAFGLGDAAGVAASMVAAGVQPGEDLVRTLKLVGDAASIAGVDMGTMGGIFGKVAASNKVQMDVINQLHDKGVPALSLLAQQMGVTAEEASRMASAGEIDFATFQAAMEAGLGGAALESGATFSGALDNMWAAFGRFGEKLLVGIFPQLQSAFLGMTAWVNSLGPAATVVGQILADTFTNVFNTIVGVVEWVQANSDWLAPLVVAVTSFVVVYKLWTGAITAWKAVTQAATIVQIAMNAAMAANPIGIIIALIAALVAGLVWFFTQTEVGREAWANFTQFLGEAWDNVVAWVTAVATGFGDWWTSFWSGFAGWITDLWNTITGTIRAVFLAYVTWIMSTLAAFVNWWNALWTGVGKFITDTWNGFIKFITDTFNLFLLGLRIIGETISSWWNSLWTGIGNFVNDVWNNIVNFVTAYINLVLSIIRAVMTTVSAVWDAVWSGISSFFTGIWNGILSAVGVIRGVFETVFGAISGIVRGAFDGVVSVIRGVINSIISLVNGVIGSINGVAGAIGGAIGLDISIGKIPMLAKGGTLTSSGAVIVGERGPELLNLPKGASVNPDISGANGSKNYTVIAAPGRTAVQELEDLVNRTGGGGL